MQQQDHLMKQIDQLGQVLGKLIADFLGLKHTGQLDAGIEISSQVLKRELDLDINELLQIPTDQLIRTLLSKKNLTKENIGKIAEMLSLLAESRNDWSKNLHEKCLTIYEWMQREEAVYSLERQWEIERIKNILEPSA